MSSSGLPGFRRAQYAAILSRLREPRRFMQVLAGPRQVGKTTLARQMLGAIDLPHHYASADDAIGRDPGWLQAQWEAGRLGVRARRGAVLVLDEVQKVPRWAETVKALWDEDTRNGRALRVLLLGSSPLLLQAGLTESLAGRFEVVRLGHWSFEEMRAAFGWSLDRYIYFGGYPGAASLVRDRARWAGYILDSLVETTVSRDILLLARVDKPALLRRLFHLACEYSGQIVSYTKMLGQLTDAGNTTTLAHYLDLLAGAGMVTGLQKFSGSRIRHRGSSPKLLALNTGLVTAQIQEGLSEIRSDSARWGRLVETAVGAHLLNSAAGTGIEVLYWRGRSVEVDYVLRLGARVVAIEVASGRRKDTRPGFDAFLSEYPRARVLLVGSGGIPLEDVLASPASSLFE